MSEQATTPPCIIVVFGARGDLTKRLVMPALYNLRRSGALGDEFAIVGMDHGDISERAWRTNMGQSMTQLLSSRDAEFQTDEFDTATWDWLRERMHYLRGDFTDQEPTDRWAACWTSCTSAMARRATCCSIWPPPRASSSRYCSTWARLASSGNTKAKAGAG